MSGEEKILAARLEAEQFFGIWLRTLLWHFIIMIGALGGVPSQIRRNQFIHPMLAVSASALARSSARRRLLDAAAVRHARSRAHVPPKLDSLLWLHDLALLFASEGISTNCATIDFFVAPSNTGKRRRSKQNI